VRFSPTTLIEAAWTALLSAIRRVPLLLLVSASTFSSVSHALDPLTPLSLLPLLPLVVVVAAVVFEAPKASLSCSEACRLRSKAAN
jgi:hypothetical protein